MHNPALTENSQKVDEQTFNMGNEVPIESAQASSESTTYIQSWRVKEEAIEAPLETCSGTPSIYEELHTPPEASKQDRDVDSLNQMLILQELQNPTGMTALMRAVVLDRLDCLKELIPISDPNRKDVKGFTALMYAAYEGNVECVKALIPVSNANLQDKDGFTALMIATSLGYTDCVKALIPVSAVNDQSKSGRTALMVAAMFNRLELIDLLLPFSDAYLVDCEGKSAADLAGVQESGVRIRHYIAEQEAQNEAYQLEGALDAIPSSFSQDVRPRVL